MALKNNIFHSTVADLIDFDPEENPPWRKNVNETSTRDMIEEIVQIKQRVPTTRDLICDVMKRRLDVNFYYHCNIGEEHGLQSKKQIERFLEEIDKNLNYTLSVEEQETLNLMDAYFCLITKSAKEDYDYRGLLDESMLRDANRVILRKCPRNDRYTRAGMYCDNPRVTEFRGETYRYQDPEDMQEAVCVLLDRFNSLFIQSKNRTDESDRLLHIFKSIAWLLFELLDLHPFSDGNGRLCRLLCGYILSTCTPFPSPIYNISSSKYDFVNALVTARKSKTRHPCELTTIIIESNLASWRKLAELCKVYNIDNLNL